MKIIRAFSGRIDSQRLPHLVIGGLLSIFLMTMLLTAWVADDAYMTFRTIDNWTQGYGLRWNIAERVQVYTHPLWMMLLTAAYVVTHEIWLTSILLSCAVSLAAVYLVSRSVAPTFWDKFLSVTLLLTSKAFIDYATSGLENPVAYLLVIIFYIFYFYPHAIFSRQLFWLLFITSLLALTRLDLILIVAPALLVSVVQERHRLSSGTTLGWGIAGLLPFIAWEAFSVVYYGFPFPNTAYAKVFIEGISRITLIQHGIYYLLNSLQLDPATLVIIAVAIIIAWHKGNQKLQPIVAGILLYIIYIVIIGGDFMSGRFLAVPFLASVVVLSRLQLKWRSILIISGAMFLLSLMSPYSPLRPALTYSVISHQQGHGYNHGIADERAYYFANTGLLPYIVSPFPLTNSSSARTITELTVIANIFNGRTPFRQGPQLHAVNTWAITDPLLARLPVRAEGNWRVGHLVRTVPAGYLRSIETGTNHICDPSVASFYNHLRSVTEGPLWSRARWKAIWQLNTGQLDHLLKDFDAMIGGNESVC